MSSFKIGCDPEFFLKKDGKFISAHDRVPGTKEKPHPLPGGGHVQADGLAVEFNIPASSTKRAFVNNIKQALVDIRQEFFKNDKDIEFSFSPVALFDLSYFKTLPEYALELGCEPDFNAYSGGKVNPRPSTSKPMRTGSGHIHVGYLSGDDMVEGIPSESPEHMDDCVLLSMAMDANFMLNKSIWDGDVERASLYGRPGCFRPKKYGMEYRSPSNSWLNYPDMWPWIFDATEAAVDSVKSGEFILSLRNSFGRGADFRYYVDMYSKYGKADPKKPSSTVYTPADMIMKGMVVPLTIQQVSKVLVI